MNILYCGDKGISDGVLISILSLLKNNNEPLEIFILTIKYEGVVPFTKKAADFLDKLVKEKNAKSFVKLIDAFDFCRKFAEKKYGFVFYAVFDAEALRR